MKTINLILVILLVSMVLVSGCIKREATEKPIKTPATGKIAQQQVEEQASNLLEQELEEAIGNVTLEDLENELLQQS